MTNRIFKLENKKNRGFEKNTIDMSVSDSHLIVVATEIVDVEMPFLMCLQMLRHIRDIFNIDNNRLTGNFDCRLVPLVSKMRYLYADCLVWVLLA